MCYNDPFVSLAPLVTGIVLANGEHSINISWVIEWDKWRKTIASGEKWLKWRFGDMRVEAEDRPTFPSRSKLGCFPCFTTMSTRVASIYFYLISGQWCFTNGSFNPFTTEAFLNTFSSPRSSSSVNPKQEFCLYSVNHILTCSACFVSNAY